MATPRRKLISDLFHAAAARASEERNAFLKEACRGDPELQLELESLLQYESTCDRLTRFSREAQTLAALNHPNIAQFHGLEESAGVRALVMELVEGEDFGAAARARSHPTGRGVTVARDKIVFNLGEHSGNVWMTELLPDKSQ